jgi:hypothetical protein
MKIDDIEEKTAEPDIDEDALGHGLEPAEGATEPEDHGTEAEEDDADDEETDEVHTAPTPSVGRIVHTLPGTPDGPIPAIITRVHSPTCVNLTVFGDGQAPHFLSSAVLGEQWAWPPRV